jgi:two-component system, LuxR family, sensor kinase FixL
MQTVTTVGRLARLRQVAGISITGCDGNGLPVLVVHEIVMDPITENSESIGMSGRTRREDQILELRKKIASLEAQASGIALAQVMTRSFEGEIRYWSRGMERLYGFSADEALGRISHRLLHTEFPRSLDDVDEELLARDEWTGELRHRRRDGEEIIVVSHQSLRRAASGDKPLVTEVNNDITEERRNREARLYLASIVETSEDAIVGKTLDGVVTTWNQAAEAMFGYAAAEMLGQPIARLLPRDRQSEEAMILARLRQGERLRHFETVRLRKDGSEIAVSLTVSPILNGSGQIIGASKIVRDVTADRQSRSRIQELQAELVHVSRLSTMGQMASAIAHELNQPLTAIGNYAGALSRVLAAESSGANGDRARDIVGRIRQQTNRAGEVIRRLRDHVAKRNTTRQREDINAVIKEAVELGLVGTRHQGVRTTVSLDEAAGTALIDRIQIGQVLINLVRNAVEAMEASERRELLISTHASADAVEIAVTDSGPGLAPEVADRLFEPFVTSKASGLGLGLSICRELIEAHGGALSAAPGATGGMVFTIRLPTAAGTEERA